MDKIPTEVLIHILLFCFPFKRQRKVRKTLARVCYFWRTAIYGNRLFWTEVGLHRTTEELRETLRRNPDGPLDITWTPSNCNKSIDKAGMERVAMITPQSHRWRSLVLAGAIKHEFQSQIINVPTPRLVSFTFVGSWFETPELRLASEGAPLRELTLGWTALDWQNPRLRGLRCLRLHEPGSREPTMGQLHAILSASLGLEILDLAFWTYRFQHQPRLESLPAILLPSLTTLAVEKVQSIVLRTLLSYIRAPNCRYIRLPTIDQADFLDHYPLEELGRLWQGPLSTVPRLTVSYDRAYGICTLNHRQMEPDRRPQPNTGESSLKLAQRRGVYLRTERLILPSQSTDAICLNEQKVRKYLQKVVLPALHGLSGELQLDLDHLWPHYTRDPINITPPKSVARDLLLNMPRVTHLRLKWSVEPLEILRFLSARQPVRTMDGEAGQGLSWPVPRMESLTVAYISKTRSGVLKALDVLISHRGSGTLDKVAATSAEADEPEDEASHAPRPLKRIFLQNGIEIPLQIWDSDGGWKDDKMVAD